MKALERSLVRGVVEVFPAIARKSSPTPPSWIGFASHSSPLLLCLTRRCGFGAITG